MDVVVRELTVGDLEAADGIYRASYRSSESRGVELRRYLGLPSSCWLLALDRGEPVGMVGAVSYGSFGYLGLMGVRPEAQRRGIGRVLMGRILDWADGLGVPTVLLDATEEGAPLYAACGFVEMDRALLFRLGAAAASPGPPARAGTLGREALDSVVPFDAGVFGAERGVVLRALLAEFPGRALVCYDADGAVTGYLVAQARRLGPWVARGPAEAEALLQAALSLTYSSPPTVIVPEANATGRALLSRQGFTLVRSCRHMWRGRAPSVRRRDLIYGQESFAIG